MQQKITTLSLPISLRDSVRMAIFAGLSLLSFTVPFSLGHPQWLVGAIVNACLFLSVIFLPKRFYLPLLVFPSLGILARGIIFGPFTPFLAYFLPFIWLGNLILVLLFKKAYNLNYFFSVLVAALAKFLFLWLIANLYFKFNVVPQAFLQAMGIFQLMTALAGGIISLIIFRAWKKEQQR